MTATSEDVARVAGVSTATVSRALRGVDGVNARTRERVLAVARELGYAASPAASRLAGGRTGTVAVVVPYITRWFFSEVISGAEQVLRERGMDLLLYNLGHVEGRERYFSGEVLRQRADAVLVLCLPLSQAELEALGGSSIPVALVGADVEHCPSVRIDDVAGARAAVRHLVNLGHERIALIAGVQGDPMGFTTPEDRRRGYRETLAEAGLPVGPDLEVAGDFTVEGGASAMAQLLSLRHPPTAVFAESDEMAFGAMRTLRNAGMSVPRDISLIGFDDHELADLMNLSTIAQPVREQGARAAELLLEVLDGGDGVEQRVIMPTRLVVRGSTGPLDRNHP
ncbi:MAG TPA: LacI family DNA-binding transcriptional regulator [Actinospica sp.]|nr:LacI family DNA-binding transcriptional regulator [Actinospica sp.]